MNKRTYGIVLVFSLVLLGACSLYDAGSGEGSVSMRFALQRAAGNESASALRVWVYSNNTLIPNSGADYYSAGLSNGAGSIKIEGLPAGDNYRLVVAAGTLSGSSFKTERYGMSAAFPVKTGSDTGVSLQLVSLSTDMTPTADALKSVVVTNGGTVTAASDSKLYHGSTLASISPTSWTLGGSINSVSTGFMSSGSQTFLLVNTSNGVYQDLTGAGTFTRVGNAIAPVPKDGQIEAEPGALQSGSYDGVYFFQGERQFGGLVGDPTTTNWAAVKLDIAGLAGKPVMDFFVLGTNLDDISGFFATKFVGAFRVGKNFIEGEPSIDKILDKDNSLFSFFGEDLPLVQAFGFTGDVYKTLYLGTKSGAYRTTVASLSGASALGTTPALVPGTRGINITKIVVSGNGTAAMLSAGELVVVKDSKVYRMPFVTGLVGNLTDVAWLDPTTVLVTGTSGIGSVSTAGL